MRERNKQEEILCQKKTGGNMMKEREQGREGKRHEEIKGVRKREEGTGGRRGSKEEEREPGPQ